MDNHAHKIGYLVPIFLTVFVIIVTFIFNGLASSGPNAIFRNATGDVSDAYYLEVTPAGWAFSIWGIIYTWQCIWIGYALSTICRKGIDGYLYYSPVIMPPAMFIVYVLNLACNITWLVLWDREFIPGALVIIALLPVTLIVSLFISYRAVYINLSLLAKHGLSKEIWWIRWTVQNGMAFYAAWTCIATNLNLGIVLAYWADMEQSAASSVALSVLAVEILGWFIIDIFVLDKYGTRYTFSPYIVVVWALIGILAKNYKKGATNTIFTMLLLVLGSIALIAKIVVMTVRHFYRKSNPATARLEYDPKIPTF